MKVSNVPLKQIFLCLRWRWTGWRDGEVEVLLMWRLTSTSKEAASVQRRWRMNVVVEDVRVATVEE